jgi:hypothetical protein
VSAQHELRGRGILQHQTDKAAAAREKRFEEELRVAKLGRDHYWIALFGYRVTMPLPADDVLFDLENLRTGPMIGCYICEQAYSDRMATRACQGEPG